MDLQELTEYCHGPFCFGIKLPGGGIFTGHSEERFWSHTVHQRHLASFDVHQPPAPHQRLEFQCCVVVLGYHCDSNGPPQEVPRRSRGRLNTALDLEERLLLP